MAGFALGLPIVTTDGSLTETIWRDRGAVAFALVGATEEFVGTVRGKSLYFEKFAVEPTLSTPFEIVGLIDTAKIILPNKFNDLR